MHAVFLGTPAAAVASLSALADVIDVSCVITRPDAARGRSKQPIPSPVKEAALEWGFPVAQPATNEELAAVLAALEPSVGLVVAYGRILKPEVIEIPYRGFVNVHFSLLPRWRGAAPVTRALLAGDTKTGVSLMQIDEGLDSGPILARVETPIAADETGGSLTARLAHLGSLMVDDVLPAFLRGEVRGAPQIDSAVTHAARLTRAEAQVYPGTTADQFARSVRGYHPRPGAWMVVGGSNIKIHHCVVASEDADRGRVVPGSENQVLLGCTTGAVELITVQPPGKRPMSAADWLRGMHGREVIVEERT